MAIRVFPLAVCLVAVGCVLTLGSSHATATVPVRDTKVVAASIRSCASCRLNNMPKLRDFLHNDAKEYKSALTIDFITGRDPVLFLLNKAGKTVQEISLNDSHDAEAMAALLGQHGITKETERPPVEFTPTAVCAAWRQTATCNPKGNREPEGDAECGDVVPAGRSGYCECIGRPNFLYTDWSCNYNGDESDDADIEDFTCESKCAAIEAAAIEPNADL